jgi:periplasmic protein TonB
MRITLAVVLLILCCSFLVAQAAHESPKAAKPGKIYHIGGDVKAPRVILAPQPVLDDDEKEIARENIGKRAVDVGSTSLLIVVAEDGSVRSVKVSRSLNRDLDTKAVEAVKTWRFEPGTKKGIPVAVELGVNVDFHSYR